ncbi:hypothetical protein ACLOJK_008670 [Asimina triloba]
MANPKILIGRCTHPAMAHQIGSCGEQSPKSIGHPILYTTPISSPTASIFHHHRRMPKSSRPPLASPAAEDGPAPSNLRFEQPCPDPADAPATVHHHGVRLLHNRAWTGHASSTSGQQRLTITIGQASPPDQRQSIQQQPERQPQTAPAAPYISKAMAKSGQ